MEEEEKHFPLRSKINRVPKIHAGNPPASKVQRGGKGMAA